MKKLTLLCLTFAAVVAHATVISSGGTAIPNAVVTAVGLGSAALLTISGNYNFNVLPADISASYVETAYADTTNPFNTISGIYDTTIVLKITVHSGTATIERATLGYFGGFETAVSYLAGSSAISSLATRDSLGAVIGYDFAGLTPGDVETLVVYTNARGADTGGAVSIQDGTAGYNVGLSAAPEPRSATLLGGGLAFLLFVFLRLRHSPPPPAISGGAPLRLSATLS
jgi:hypothetical protein